MMECISKFLNLDRGIGEYVRKEGDQTLPDFVGEVGERIKIDKNKLLSDALPEEWTRAGLTKLDFTLLWRHFAQQLKVEQIAEILCVYESQRAVAANYFVRRIANARRIVKDRPLNPARLTGLAKLLPGFLR